MEEFKDMADSIISTMWNRMSDDDKWFVFNSSEEEIARAYWHKCIFNNY